MGDLASSLAPLVSVVVLNFNGERHLEECLYSLLRQTYRPLEILVADNGSHDRSQEVVARWDSVRWVALGENHGFAKGNNLGARAASGELLVFVNNDMRFAEDFVERLIDPFHRDPIVFATDARQRDWDDTIDLHLRTVLRRTSLRSYLQGRRTPLPGIDIEQVPAATPVVEVQACAGNMAVRRWMFESLGGFDVRMKAGWEDADISFSAWLRGWKIVFVPGAVCWHKVGATSKTKEGQEIRRRGELEGRLIIATRHLPAGPAVIAWLSTAFSAARDGPRSDKGGAGVSRSALLAALGWLPALVGERRRLYQEARTTPRGHLSRLEALADVSELPTQGHTEVDT